MPRGRGLDGVKENLELGVQESDSLENTCVCPDVWNLLPDSRGSNTVCDGWEVSFTMAEALHRLKDVLD